MSATRAHRVPPDAAGERLDRFLAAAEPDLSRSRVQSLIEDGHVTVNARRARAAQRLRAGDAVALEVPARTASATLAAEPVPLAIVHQDDDLLVVDKPAGLVVHPGAGVRSGTLAHGLLHHDPAIAGVGGADRPGIVHRLDRDTSGLLVVARTARAHRALVEAMRRREVRRVYLALVWGDPPEDEDTIVAPIARDPRERKRMAVARRGGRAAVTHVRVLERFGVAALVEVRLETGRTHQIRVHLAHRRLPVVGDAVYGGRKKALSPDAARRSLVGTLLEGLGRQALHASRLAFAHPVTGVPLSFRSALPEDFTRALEALRAYRERGGR
jgi:23S rRNA pseudouridine1911/1915/1917 synthase